MYLSALEIQGFKSFPNRQNITFHPGYTCIVGPNGCGKSNVTDAVRWVLGEQSAKSMRGNKMQDVIFNGTADRKRMSFAEVSMHINNQDGYLDLPYQEVVITRRYYRSGESEYAINHQACRLKDITQLFADTGLGKGGYSIIEQGRVDEILSDKAEERRKFFDEAAGVVKYKMRKNEAERKLARTEDDILRLDDIVREIERNLKPLAKQAEAAKTYQKISAEVRDLDILLTCRRLTTAENDSAQARAQQQELSKSIEQAKQALSTLKTEREKVLEHRHLRQKEADELQAQYNAGNREIAVLAEDLALSTDLFERSKKRMQEIDPEIRALDFNSHNWQEKLKDRESHRKTLVERQVAYSKEIFELEEQSKVLADRLSAQEKLIAEHKNRILQIQEELFTERSTAISRQSRIESEKTELESAELELKILTENLREANEERQSRASELLQIQEIHAKQRQKLLEKQRLCNLLEQKITEEQAELERISQEEKQLSYELTTLNRLEDNREGYHYAVKNLSRNMQKDPSFAEGFLGTVAELSEVDEKYELAVEMSLGGSLHNIVCRDAGSAQRFINWLKFEKAGRETFLPLDKLNTRGLPREILNAVEGVPGYLGLLSDFIVMPEDLSEVNKYLAGRILLAKDMDSALRVSEASNNRYKVVSLEGDLINPGGSMTGGANKKGLSGLLSRSREIESHEKRLAELAHLKTHKTDFLKESQAQLKAKHSARQDLVAEEATSLAGLQSAKETLAAADSKLTNIERSWQELEQKTQKRREHIVSLEAEAAAGNPRIDSLESELEASERFLEQSPQDHGVEEAALSQLREKLTDLKISAASVEEAIKGIDELKAQLYSEQESREIARKKLNSEQAELKQLLESKQSQSQDLRRKKAALEAKLQAISTEQEALKVRNAEGLAKESAIFQRIESLNASLNSLEAEQVRSLNRTERLEEKLISEKNRIWEEYRLSFNQAKDLAASLDSTQADPKRLQLLKEKLRNMPAVNHAAPEQFTELQERYELMTSQKDDILKSKEQLLSVIKELEDAMREQFCQEFAAINKEFQNCFTELFSGGTACLNLGEGDVLDCEINIKAQPPGKRLQNLSLLSGGERALTAIALVFAIFRQKPAPFCFLDEVDSALDEANVIRFATFIRSYTEHTQFVVVTHRKGSMEEADRLYGVTMKERGVSTILSLDLEEGAQYAEA